MEINFNKVSNCAQETEEPHRILGTCQRHRGTECSGPSACAGVINKHLHGHSSDRRLTKPHNGGEKGHFFLIDGSEMLIYSFLMDLNVQVFSLHRN